MYPTFPGSDKGLLDIYLPDEGEGPFPVILYIHGGAWIGGHQQPYHPRLAHRPGPRLRGCGGQLYPGPGRGFSRPNLRRQGRPRPMPTNIAWIPGAWLIGDSAGGHLVSLLGVSAGRDELEDLSMGNEAYDSSVQAVVDWYGPVDFLHYTQDFAQEGVTCEMPPCSPSPCCWVADPRIARPGAVGQSPYLHYPLLSSLPDSAGHDQLLSPKRTPDEGAPGGRRAVNWICSRGPFTAASPSSARPIWNGFGPSIVI